MVLEREGFDVVSLFFKGRDTGNNFEKYSGDELAYLVEQIYKLGPALVGISVMSAFFDVASEITGRIKELDSAPLVLWGGIHPTIRPEQCLEVADVVCVGEGEEAVVELAMALRDKADISSIKNLWMRGHNNELRPLIQDLDSLPFASCSRDQKYIVEKRRMQPYDYNKVVHREGFRFMTSRGCPFGCAYCANSFLRAAYKGKGRYLRQRSVDNVIQELVHLKNRYRLGLIHFFDDVFAVDFEWTREFCEKYKEKVGGPFWCYCQPRATDEKTLLLLKDVGLVQVQIGIQSGSERIRRDYFKRYDTNNDILRSVNTLCNVGVAWGCDLIVDNPAEKAEDYQQTAQLLSRFPRPFSANIVTLTHFPEYELTRRFLAEGKIREEDVEDQMSKGFKHSKWDFGLDPQRAIAFFVRLAEAAS